MLTGHVWVVIALVDGAVRLHGAFSTQEVAETMAAGVGGCVVLRTPTYAPACRDGGHPDPGGLY